MLAPGLVLVALAVAASSAAAAAVPRDRLLLAPAHLLAVVVHRALSLGGDDGARAPGSVPVGLPLRTGDSCKILPGIDLYPCHNTSCPWDIDHIELPETLASCEKACLANPQCACFELVDMGPGSSGGGCFLKSAAALDPAKLQKNGNGHTAGICRNHPAPVPPPAPLPPAKLLWPGNTTLYIYGAACDLCNGYYYAIQDVTWNGLQGTTQFCKHPPTPFSGFHQRLDGHNETDEIVDAIDIHREDGTMQWDLGSLFKWTAYSAKPDGTTYPYGGPPTKGWYLAGGISSGPQCTRNKSHAGSYPDCPLPMLEYKPPPEPEPEPEPEPPEPEPDPEPEPEPDPVPPHHHHHNPPPPPVLPSQIQIDPVWLVVLLVVGMALGCCMSRLMSNRPRRCCPHAREYPPLCGLPGMCGGAQSAQTPTQRHCRSAHSHRISVHGGHAASIPWRVYPRRRRVVEARKGVPS